MEGTECVVASTQVEAAAMYLLELVTPFRVEGRCAIAIDASTLSSDALRYGRVTCAQFGFKERGLPQGAGASMSCCLRLRTSKRRPSASVEDLIQDIRAMPGVLNAHYVAQDDSVSIVASEGGTAIAILHRYTLFRLQEYTADSGILSIVVE